MHLHGAYGFLIDCFLRSQNNQRTDKYGGSVENRCRFVLELVDLALKHFKPYQIGLKLSPTTWLHHNHDANPLETYSYLLQRLSEKEVGYVSLVESEKDD